MDIIDDEDDFTILDAGQLNFMQQFYEEWITIADVCQSRGCWRLHRLYYEKTRLLIPYLPLEHVQSLFTKF